MRTVTNLCGRGWVRLLRVATLGRVRRVWIDGQEYARLVAAAASAEYVEHLERDIAELNAETQRMNGQALANDVLVAIGAALGQSELEHLLTDPPLDAAGELDGVAVRERIEQAVAAAAVEQLLADVFPTI